MATDWHNGFEALGLAPGLSEREPPDLYRQRRNPVSVALDRYLGNQYVDSVRGPSGWRQSKRRELGHLAPHCIDTAVGPD